MFHVTTIEACTLKDELWIDMRIAPREVEAREREGDRVGHVEPPRARSYGDRGHLLLVEREEEEVLCVRAEQRVE